MVLLNWSAYSLSPSLSVSILLGHTHQTHFEISMRVNWILWIKWEKKINKSSLGCLGCISFSMYGCAPIRVAQWISNQSRVAGSITHTYHSNRKHRKRDKVAKTYRTQRNRAAQQHNGKVGRNASSTSHPGHTDKDDHAKDVLYARQVDARQCAQVGLGLRRCTSGGTILARCTLVHLHRLYSIVVINQSRQQRRHSLILIFAIQKHLITVVQALFILVYKRKNKVKLITCWRGYIETTCMQ